MKRSNELAHLRLLCDLPLPAPMLVPALLRSLRQLVAFDSAAFFWVDDRLDMAAMYAERLLPPPAMRRYFDKYYDHDQHAFRRRLAEQLDQNRLIWQSSAERSAQDGGYQQEVLAKLGVHHALYLLVHDSGRVSGQLSLYRGHSAPPFSAGDELVLAGTRHYLAACLGRPSTGHERFVTPEWRDSEHEGLVTCDESGAIEHASYRAHALLVQASGLQLNRASVLDGSCERASTRLLVAQVAGMASNTGPETPAERLVDNAWGRFRLRTYVLGDRRYGVLVTRQEHLLVRIADAMRLRPLSAQQREVALLLARGLTNPEIAQALDVSLNTASYHVKQLFQKLDAHDRAEAIARILDGHTERRG